MKIIALAFAALSLLASSALAGHIYIEDDEGCSYEEYIRLQQLQDRLDEINERLDFEAKLNFVYSNNGW